jgi:hypothetical protein
MKIVKIDFFNKESRKLEKFGTFLSIIIVIGNEDLTERVKMGDVHCFFFGLKRE